MRASICSTVIVLSLFSCLCSSARADAESEYKSLFGPDDARLSASGDRAAQAAFAGKLFKAASQASYNRNFQALLCQKAYDFALRHPAGYATAVDACKLLLTVAPDKKELWRERLKKVYRQQGVDAKGEERTQARQALFDLHITEADEYVDAGDYQQAAQSYRIASELGRSIASPKVAGIEERLRLIAAQEQMARKLETLHARIKANPKDSAARADLILHYLGEEDDPAEAAKFLDGSVDDRLRTYVPLAAKAIGQLTDTVCLELAQWYTELVPRLSDVGKAIVLTRATACCERYLEVHTTRDTSRLKAKMLLDQAQKQLEELDRKLDERRTAQFQVNAKDEQWTKTVTLRKGDIVTVAAEGKWSVDANKPGTVCDASGVDGGMVGALVGRVGESGTVFKIGTRKEYAAKQDGVLEMRMHDYASGGPAHYNNVGTLSVTIYHLRKGSQVLSRLRPPRRKSETSTAGVAVDHPSPRPDHKTLTLDLGKGVTMKLVLIPAGKFLMGSPDTEKGRKADEGPQHEVTISKPFYMGVYEVTQVQYEAVVGTNPSQYKGETRPVEKVSWHDAVEFCKRLSAKTGMPVRLPTEAEWEYSCRAGTKTRFSFGDEDTDLHAYGNYADRSCTAPHAGKKDTAHSDGFDRTAPVGQFRANAFGVFDMHGNVWEWCGDWYGSYASAGVRDPVGPGSGSLRVLRGGGWHNSPGGARSAVRAGVAPASGADLHGFRVVVVLAPNSQPVPSKDEPTRTPPTGEPLVLDLGQNVTMKLVLIPAGKFMMGSPDSESGRDASREGRQREVTISKPFYMGIHEVTQEQYEAVVGSNPSEFKGRTRPVEQVSWNDAVEFCKRLSAKSGKTVRLPSEAQWEYACRAGSTTRFSFGDDDAVLHKHGNYADRSCTAPYQGKKDEAHSDGFDRTAPVGSFKPNAFGLYDMHGNVGELCGDWYGSYASASARDPAGPDSGSDRVLRGGGWHVGPAVSRSASRSWRPPDYRYGDFGFRVVVQDPPGSQPVLQRDEPTKTTPTGKPLTLDLGNNLTMKLALIPAGKFMMGSPNTEKSRQPNEGPQREVTISTPFYMGICEVTQEEYQTVMGSHPGVFKRPTNPVEAVTWEEAVAFCNRVSAKTQRTVRLPTEAEWEYACRAGTTTRFSFGDDGADFHKFGNYLDRSNTDAERHQDKNHSDGFDKTAPVGSFQPNPWGLYDMHGNVHELCADWSGPYSAPGVGQGGLLIDPKGPASGTHRIARGGGWDSGTASSRSAFRYYSGPTTRGCHVGFRVVVECGTNSSSQPPSRPRDSSTDQMPVRPPVKPSLPKDDGRKTIFD